MEDPEEQYKKFVAAARPSLDDFKLKLNEFMRVEASIDQIEASTIVGSVKLKSGMWSNNSVYVFCAWFLQ